MYDVDTTKSFGGETEAHRSEVAYLRSHSLLVTEHYTVCTPEITLRSLLDRASLEPSFSFFPCVWRCSEKICLQLPQWFGSPDFLFIICISMAFITPITSQGLTS